MTYLMTVEEIRMTCIDITCFHGDQVFDELVRRLHRLFEELDDHGVELFL